MVVEISVSTFYIRNAHRAHRMTVAGVTVVTQLLTHGEKVSRWRVEIDEFIKYISVSDK